MGPVRCPPHNTLVSTSTHDSPHAPCSLSSPFTPLAVPANQIQFASHFVPRGGHSPVALQEAGAAADPALPPGGLDLDVVRATRLDTLQLVNVLAIAARHL